MKSLRLFIRLSTPISSPTGKYRLSALVVTNSCKHLPPEKIHSAFINPYQRSLPSIYCHRRSEKRSFKVRESEWMSPSRVIRFNFAQISMNTWIWGGIQMKVARSMAPSRPFRCFDLFSAEVCLKAFRRYWMLKSKLCENRYHFEPRIVIRWQIRVGIRISDVFNRFPASWRQTSARPSDLHSSLPKRCCFPSWFVRNFLDKHFDFRVANPANQAERNLPPHHLLKLILRLPAFYCF